MRDHRSHNTSAVAVERGDSNQLKRGPEEWKLQGSENTQLQKAINVRKQVEPTTNGDEPGRRSPLARHTTSTVSS